MSFVARIISAIASYCSYCCGLLFVVVSIFLVRAFERWTAQTNANVASHSSELSVPKPKPKFKLM